MAGFNHGRRDRLDRGEDASDVHIHQGAERLERLLDERPE